MFSEDLIANLQTNEEYNRWVTELKDNNSSLNLVTNIEDAYMATKRRSPMTFEYYKSASDTQPTSVTLYINPDKLSFSNQKLIGKQVTRGGIFYNHYGADHSQIQLGGTVGLSSMKGIEQLNEIYMASGTLLKYKGYQTDKTYGSFEDYGVVDYKDPVGVITNITSTTDIETLNNQANSYISTQSQSTISSDKVFASNVLNILNSYMSNCNLGDYHQKILNVQDKLINLRLEAENNNSTLSYNDCYQTAMQLIKNACPTLHDNIVVEMSYQIAQANEIAKSGGDGASVVTSNNIMSQVTQFYIDRQTAILDHINNLKQASQRDKKIRDILNTGLRSLTADLKDEWLPRMILMYFEDRVYIGHFNTFSYNRTAATPLITYDLRFTVIKQILAVNGTAPIVTDESTIPITSTTSTDNSYYVVQSGDTLKSLATKFYNQPGLWPEIYADNLDVIADPMNLIINTKLKITSLASLSKDYWRWVILQGDTLASISQTFFGDESHLNDVYRWNESNISLEGDLPARTILYIHKSNNSVTDEPNIITYTTKGGESLDALAQKYYNDPSLWTEIYAINEHNIPNPNSLSAGITLNINMNLSKIYLHWVTHTGDTLESISNRFFGSTKYAYAIYRANESNINETGPLPAYIILQIPRNPKV